MPERLGREQFGFSRPAQLAEQDDNRSAYSIRLYAMLFGLTTALLCRIIKWVRRGPHL